MDIDIELLTAIATIGLLLVNAGLLWAAKRSADAAERELLLARRPAVTLTHVSATYTPSAHAVTLSGTVEETSGVPTVVHRAACRVAPARALHPAGQAFDFGPTAPWRTFIDGDTPLRRGLPPTHYWLADGTLTEPVGASGNSVAMAHVRYAFSPDGFPHFEEWETSYRVDCDRSRGEAALAVVAMYTRRIASGKRYSAYRSRQRKGWPELAGTFMEVR